MTFIEIYQHMTFLSLTHDKQMCKFNHKDIKSDLQAA